VQDARGALQSIRFDSLSQECHQPWVVHFGLATRSESLVFCSTALIG
jgi:hypothetical protein